MEQLLDAVLALPALSSLDLFGAVFEVFSGFFAFGLFALLADSWGGLLWEEEKRVERRERVDSTVDHSESD